MPTKENDRAILYKEIIGIIESITQTNIKTNEFSLSEFDSISLIRIIVAIEEKYNFEFSDEMLSYDTLATVDKIIDIILEIRLELNQI